MIDHYPAVKQFLEKPDIVDNCFCSSTPVYVLILEVAIEFYLILNYLYYS